MKIISTNPKKKITGIEGWKPLIEEKHWKAGRSAQTLAEFILKTKPLGLQLDNILKGITNTIPGLDEIIFDEAYPEFEVRFDNYQNGRKHDLGLFGRTKVGKNIFVGIEAKVDEEFGNTIEIEYANAVNARKNGEYTNKPERIKALMQDFFSSQIKKPYSTLRYQLLHGLAGTVKHVKAPYAGPDYMLFVVLVFKTKGFGTKVDYDSEKGEKNYSDYLDFINSLMAIDINKNQSIIPYVRDNRVYEISLKDGKIVYSAYIEVDAKNLNGLTNFS